MANQPTIVQGTCTVMLAYDVGFGINLDRAEEVLAAQAGGGDRAQREVLPHSRRSPRYFGYRPSPLRIMRQAKSVHVADRETDAMVTLTAFDFGAVSIAYTIPIDGPVHALPQLSEALYENAQLLADSRAHAGSLLDLIRAAVLKPKLMPFVEDYVVFRGKRLECGAQPIEEYFEGERAIIAAIVRAETGPLSRQEITDATRTCISYSPTDAAVIDWNAAILIGDDMEDAQAVLEFANVELLEMRFLDDQLDRALETAYAATGVAPRAFWNRKGMATLRDIAGLQMDSALLFETVNNTLKLLGDQHLARIYRAAAEQLHIPDWDASIIRKLGTLESIYAKLIDRQSTRRMEVLEWIVILLIAFEIVTSFQH